MSRKAMKPSPKTSRKPIRKVDRRVLRTRDALGDALVTLMHERPFEAITVQHVLDRAGVSRSTFYTHYSDKNDLFLGDVEDFFEMMSTLISRRGEVSNRVAPVRELFAHVSGEARDFYAALVASGKVADVLEIGQESFARAIERRFSELPQARAMAEARRAALAQAHAGALLSLLMWWIRRGMRESPAEMDELFHQMVWSGAEAPASASAGKSSSAGRKSLGPA
jgi:AcrR family transcriptional regulator